MPSTTSKRFRSATAAVQGRGVASNKGKTGPSITSLVPDVLQSAGPRLTVASKRNIFMHARAYLNAQCRSNQVDERKLMIKSVIAGTRLHQKQENSVTTLQEHLIEQQEERKRSKEKEEEELLALESSQDQPEEVEEEYHAASTSLTSMGILHEQVAKLARLSKSYKEDSLIHTAGTSAQNCVGLLSTLRSKLKDDEELLKYIQEAQKTGVVAASFLQDLQGELARMREALQSAKEQVASSTEQQDVLQMVGTIYEDIAKLQLEAKPAVAVESVLESESQEVVMGEDVHETDEVDPVEEDVAALNEDAAPLNEVPQDPELIPTADVEEEEQQPMEVTDVAVADVAPTSSLTLPSLTEASEVPNPEVPTKVLAAVARSSSGLPVLVEDGEDGEVMEAVTTLLGPVEEADCHMESASPSLPRLAPEAPEAPEVEGTEAPAATALPPAPPGGIPEKVPAQVRKVRRQLIMAPEIRLPALSRRNRKNTVDLDWNMEHLNQEELKLLNSVIAEDGMEASKSVVHDPKKERLWKQIWGLAESPRRRALPRVEDVDEDSFLVPRKVHTLPELSEKSPSASARGVRHRRVS